METINNEFTLDLSGGFPLSTDSMVLADFVKLPKNASVLDLGSGCATLGLLLCARDPGCTVTGIELCENAHAAAVENIRRNRLGGRLHSICGDLREIPIAPGSWRVCVSNPPYFSGGERHSRNPDARREDTCPPDALFAGMLIQKDFRRPLRTHGVGGGGADADFIDVADGFHREYLRLFFC